MVIWKRVIEGLGEFIKVLRMLDLGLSHALAGGRFRGGLGCSARVCDERPGT